jgi:hypothetical protein
MPGWIAMHIVHFKMNRMKKLFLSLLTVGVLGASAQTFQVGIKGGVNISNFNGGNFGTIEKKALIGFHAGGLLRFQFGSLLALQPEVLFSTQGTTLKNTSTSNDYKVNYINVPVLLQITPGGTGFYVEAGPQIGFRASEDIPNSSVNDFAKSTDLSIALGLGVHSKSGLGLDGRYNVGVSKVGNYTSSSINNADFKNGVIQIGLFYTLFNNNNNKKR